MKIQHFAAYLMGIAVLVKNFDAREQRGLSQSAENAILLAGAVAIAIGIITFLKGYVSSHMPN